MSTTRTIWLWLFGLLQSFAFVTMSSFPAAAQQQQRPNIVFIMGDDIGSVSYTHLTLPTTERV